MKRCLLGLWLAIGLLHLSACSLAPAQSTPAVPLLSAEQKAETLLGQALLPYLEEHPQHSGLYPIKHALDAFSMRVFLARLAEKTLDVQYYIWRKDNTGTLLLRELYLAAERGVQVRLLLDDLGSSRLDDWLALLDSHPNIEVKLFNPFALRTFRPLNFVNEFSRLNRRMHNKSFTVDQSASILGGRNIGDEYFAATYGVQFADLDMLTIGSLAADITTDFNLYWHSGSAYPLKQLFHQRQPKLALLQQVKEIVATEEAQKYLNSLAYTPFMQQLLSQELSFIWVPVQLVSDAPAKGLGLEQESDLMIFRLNELVSDDIQQLDLVSPYFVPSKKGTAALVALAQAGAKIRILTNALEATDVSAVHSGYRKYRKTLLKAGVELFEMQGRPSEEEFNKRGLGVFGSSGSSLHAKTFVVNREHVFVGSFNFDPRSARLNTEMGVLFDDAEFAEAFSSLFDAGIEQVAYQVKLDERGKLYWVEQGNPPVLHRSEPNSGVLRRSWVRFLSWWPLDRWL